MVVGGTQYKDTIVPVCQLTSRSQVGWQDGGSVTWCGEANEGRGRWGGYKLTRAISGVNLIARAVIQSHVRYTQSFTSTGGAQPRRDDSHGVGKLSLPPSPSRSLPSTRQQCRQSLQRSLAPPRMLARGACLLLAIALWVRKILTTPSVRAPCCAVESAAPLYLIVPARGGHCSHTGGAVKAPTARVRGE